MRQERHAGPVVPYNIEPRSVFHPHRHEPIRGHIHYAVARVLADGLLETR